MQPDDPGSALCCIAIARRGPQRHLWRLAYGARAACGGDKRSFGGSGACLSNRTVLGLRLRRARLHGSKPWYRGSAARGRAGTGSDARHSLQISPEAAFGTSNGFSIRASQEGIQRLSQYLWDYLAADEQGAPRPIETGPVPQSVFYAPAGTYGLGHTCNTWTAEALRVAGLPVSTAGVVFAGQVLDQLRPLLEPVSNTQSTH